MAKDIAAQQSHMAIETITEVTEKAGQVVKTHKETIPEDIFNMFEKIKMDFNDDGSPRDYSIYAGHDMYLSMIKTIEQIEKDPALKARLDQIMKTQKQNWVDRENNRKLVD